MNKYNILILYWLKGENYLYVDWTDWIGNELVFYKKQILEMFLTFRKVNKNKRFQDFYTFPI